MVFLRAKRERTLSIHFRARSVGQHTFFCVRTAMMQCLAVRPRQEGPDCSNILLAEINDVAASFSNMPHHCPHSGALELCAISTDCCPLHLALSFFFWFHLDLDPDHGLSSSERKTVSRFDPQDFSDMLLLKQADRHFFHVRIISRIVTRFINF